MRTPDLPAGGRRTSAVVVAALTVAAIVVGVAAVRLQGSSPVRSPAGSVSAASRPPAHASVIELDQGPGDDPAAVAACAGDDLAKDPSDVEVLYDMEQRSPEGTTAVLVLRGDDGDLRLCDLAGADAPGVLPLPTASPAEPVVFLSPGSGVWDCDGLVLSGYRSTTWLAVDPAVAEVEQRFVVDGSPGPWFRTVPADGIAHLQAWLGPQPEGVRIVVEHRVRDATGESVEQSALPARQELPGCTGSDVQIG